MEYQSKLPQFYKNPVPLNSETHAAMTISPSSRGFDFAASAHSVILAGVEFAEACRFFPILFSASNNGHTIPVALMGLQSGENLFVGPSGEWQNAYIPAYVRRYPFITTQGDDAGMVVCIDEAFDGLNREGGEPLFEGTAPGPYLQKSLEFLNDFYIQMKATELFCRQVQDMELLKPMNAEIQLVDNRKFNLTDFLVVDEQKLVEIAGDALEKLFRNGGLALVYAHILSLRSIQNLLDRKGVRQGG